MCWASNKGTLCSMGCDRMKKQSATETEFSRPGAQALAASDQNGYMHIAEKVRSFFLDYPLAESLFLIELA